MPKYAKENKLIKGILQPAAILAVMRIKPLTIVG
jgi:hypothetical protein